MLSEDESRHLGGPGGRRDFLEHDTTDENRFKRGLDSSIAVLSAELTQDETLY
jgi:hypothetical protein